MVYRSICASLIVLFTAVTCSLSQSSWLRVYGGSFTEEGMSISSTSDGGCLITGYTESRDVLFPWQSGGGLDVFALRLDSLGNVVWTRRYNGLYTDAPTDLAEMPDGGWTIVGTTMSVDGAFSAEYKGSRVMFVLRVDADGEFMWSKMFGGEGVSIATAVIPLEDGGCIMAGVTNSNAGDFQGMALGSSDIVVQRLGPDGSTVWMKVIGGSGYDVVTQLGVGPDHTCYVVGYSASNDGHFAGLNKGTQDAFISKLSTDGELMWMKTFGGTSDDWFRSISTTNDQEIYLMGSTRSNDGDFAGLTFHGKSDACVLKLDSAGELMWATLIGGSSDDGGHTSQYGRSIVASDDGGCVITGPTESNDGVFDKMNKGGADVFMMRLRDNGEISWKRVFGGSQLERGNSITYANDGGILMTGVSYSYDGDLADLQYWGVGDVLAIKLDANGVLVKPTSVDSESLDENMLALAYPVRVYTMLGQYIMTVDTATAMNELRAGLYFMRDRAGVTSLHSHE